MAMQPGVPNPGFREQPSPPAPEAQPQPVSPPEVGPEGLSQGSKSQGPATEGQNNQTVAAAESRTVEQLRTAVDQSALPAVEIPHDEVQTEEQLAEKLARLVSERNYPEAERAIAEESGKTQDKAK